MSTYDVEHQPNLVRIINTPAGPKFPVGRYLTMIGTTIACLYFGFANQNFLMVIGVLAMFPVGVAALGMPLFWLKWRIKGRPCGKTEIVVDGDSIMARDLGRSRPIVTAALADVSSITTGNSMSNEPLAMIHRVFGVETMFNGLYTVNVSAKGKKYCIACGMTEAGAEGLIHELTRNN